MAPNGAKRIFVPTNPDLADISDDTDFDVELFLYAFDCMGPTFPDFQVWAGLGPWAGPGGPRMGRRAPRVDRGVPRVGRGVPRVGRVGP